MKTHKAGKEVVHVFQSHCLWCAKALTLASNLYAIEGQKHGDCNSLVIKLLWR